MKYITFEDVKNMQPWAVIRDYFDEWVRCLLLRWPCSICMYIWIPNEHPLAKKNYDDLPINCHWWLTFSWNIERLQSNFYWYWWDYGHSWDYIFYDSPFNTDNAKKWTPEDVINDSWNTIYDFKKLMRLMENNN